MIISIIMSIAVPIDPWSHLDSKGLNAFGEQMGRPGAGCCEIAEISGKNLGIHGIYLWFIMGKSWEDSGKTRVKQAITRDE